MSAFIVSKRHIDYIVSAAAFWRDGFFGDDYSDSDKLGRMLWDTNHASVNCRYSENESAPKYTYELRAVEPVQVLKAIACYEYQSCEHPGWDKSEARAFCESLRSIAISRLPDYKNAAWEIK